MTRCLYKNLIPYQEYSIFINNVPSYFNDNSIWKLDEAPLNAKMTEIMVFESPRMLPELSIREEKNCIWNNFKVSPIVKKT